MKTAIFKNNAQSYLISGLLGVMSGLLVIFLSRFTTEDAVLPYFSLSTFCVWFFACSLIALFSDDNGTAGRHTAVYVLCLFNVPLTIRFIRNVLTNGDFAYYFHKELVIEISLAAIIALICFALAFVLNFGRMHNVLGWILRFMPAVLVAMDEVSCIRIVRTMHCHIATTVMQGACLIGYITVIAATMILEWSHRRKKEVELNGIYGTV